VCLRVLIQILRMDDPFLLFRIACMLAWASAFSRGPSAVGKRGRNRVICGESGEFFESEQHAKHK